MSDEILRYVGEVEAESNKGKLIWIGYEQKIIDVMQRICLCSNRLSLFCYLVTCYDCNQEKRTVV